MKKLSIYVVTAFFLVSFAPFQLSATSKPDPITAIPNRSVQSDRETVLLARLDEINAMDKSNMGRFEKKELRKETRSIKNQLNNGGVYLSVGAIIIIVLLLILLL